MANRRQAKKMMKTKASSGQVLGKSRAIRGRKPLTQKQAHVKTLAERLNARLKLLEKNKIKGPAYKRIERLIMSASKSFMVKEKDGKPRFRTDVSKLSKEELSGLEKELNALNRYESSKPSKYKKSLTKASETFNENYGTDFDINEIEHMMTLAKGKLTDSIYGSEVVADVMIKAYNTDLTDEQLDKLFTVANDKKVLTTELEDYIDMTQMSDTELDNINEERVKEGESVFSSAYEMVLDLMSRGEK